MRTIDATFSVTKEKIRVRPVETLLNLLPFRRQRRRTPSPSKPTRRERLNSGSPPTLLLPVRELCRPSRRRLLWGSNRSRFSRRPIVAVVEPKGTAKGDDSQGGRFTLFQVSLCFEWKFPFFLHSTVGRAVFIFQLVLIWIDSVPDGPDYLFFPSRVAPFSLVETSHSLIVLS